MPGLVRHVQYARRGRCAGRGAGKGAQILRVTATMDDDRDTRPQTETARRTRPCAALRRLGHSGGGAGAAHRRHHRGAEDRLRPGNPGRHLRTRPDLQDRHRGRPHGQDRHDADRAGLPGGGRDAGLGARMRSAPSKAFPASRSTWCSIRRGRPTACRKRRRSPSAGTENSRVKSSQIEGRAFAAFLFDMDGTILSSIAAAERVWTRWAERHGLDVATFLPTIHGVRAVDTIGGSPCRASTPWRRRRADAGRDRRCRRHPPDRRRRRRSCRRCRPIAGRSSPRRHANWPSARLAAAGMPAPAVLVTAEDVDRGKPAPDGFQLAAERLGSMRGTA